MVHIAAQSLDPAAKPLLDGVLAQQVVILVGTIKEKQGIGAVSYTHLDVYKRQAEETDKIELMTYGSFLKKAGSYYISYKETETRYQQPDD